MMGLVNVKIEFQGGTHEAEFEIYEEKSLIGQWYSQSWREVLETAVASVSASVAAGEQGGAE